MILLDTNVVSETTKVTPEKAVIDWLESQVAESLYLSTISLAELHLGIALMPDGRRNEALHRAVTTIIGDLFGARILAFDEKAAPAFSEIMSVSRAEGFQIGMTDGQIAAIARANDMIIATRGAGPFEAAGLTVVNPWIRSLSVGQSQKKSPVAISGDRTQRYRLGNNPAEKGENASTQDR